MRYSYQVYERLQTMDIKLPSRKIVIRGDPQLLLETEAASNLRRSFEMLTLSFVTFYFQNAKTLERCSKTVSD